SIAVGAAVLLVLFLLGYALDQSFRLDWFKHIPGSAPGTEGEIAKNKPEPQKGTPPPKVEPKSLTTRPEAVRPELKLIAGDKFQMGSPPSDSDASGHERPQHWVRITQPFYLSVHEVTRGQFRRFVEATGYQTEAEKDGKGGYGWDAAAGKWVQ